MTENNLHEDPWAFYDNDPIYEGPWEFEDQTCHTFEELVVYLRPNISSFVENFSDNEWEALMVILTNLGHTQIYKCKTLNELESFRVHWFGKKGLLTLFTKEYGKKQAILRKKG